MGGLRDKRGGTTDSVEGDTYFFLIGVLSIQDWTATASHGVARKRRKRKD